MEGQSEESLVVPSGSRIVDEDGKCAAGKLSRTLSPILAILNVTLVHNHGHNKCLSIILFVFLPRLPLQVTSSVG
jgi:hypothetical protein